MKIIGNPDWTNPAVRLKNAIVAPARRAAALAGRWTPYAAAELETRQTQTLTLSGDKPEQKRLVYAAPRPESETVQNLLYTAEGMGVADGRIVERFSIRAPSLPEILKTPAAPARRIAQGTVIEAETPYTYGDWVGDFICALVCAEKIAEPMVMPASLAGKPYVKRDIAALGLTMEVAEAPVLIEQATVLRKRIPSYYWSEKEVSAYRKAFDLTPPPAREGSITYLGRFGTVSESVQRDYPTEETAAIVKSLGGDVFDTHNSSPEVFNDMAANMETVIADQGSAIFGVMHWRTKNLIELTRRDWWHSANLFIAKGAGVENYAVIAVDDLDEAALRARIEEHLKEFGVI
ncbi:hypothetical protein ACFOOP_07400 [Marinicaulis aureus]|uniref:Uncharacterized protein n=1 Tax=Hyphococcus aureus TaxID=2666033 RepID=A0ABW1KRJ2_9PROT